MGVWICITNMFGFRLFCFSVFSIARLVTCFSQPLARFSYMDHPFHATGYLDGHVHATGCDVTVRHIEEDLWVLVMCALLAHPLWRSSSTTWSARGLIKATPAGLGDATEALVGQFGHTCGRPAPSRVSCRNGCGMSSKSHSSRSTSSKSSMNYVWKCKARC